jgi:hypothetical protein
VPEKTASESFQRIFATRSGVLKGEAVDAILRSGVKIQMLRGFGTCDEALEVEDGDVPLTTVNFRTPWVEMEFRSWLVNQSSD